MHLAAHAVDVFGNPPRTRAPEPDTRNLDRCRTIWIVSRQSGPKTGPDLQVRLPKTFKVFPFRSDVCSLRPSWRYVGGTKLATACTCSRL